MHRLDVSAEAELEIFEAALRCERERGGLGFRFEAQVDAVFARLLDNPLQFPYGVFFTVESDIITVLAVLHLHRHSDTWKRHRHTR